jgi:hypothetical protein
MVNFSWDNQLPFNPLIRTYRARRYYIDLTAEAYITNSKFIEGAKIR